MNVVTCYCSSCKAELGRFNNSWNGIGKTYFTPVYAPLSLKGLSVTGAVHEAAPGSNLENSFLQDVLCKECGFVVGLKCDKAPEGHLLTPGQLILRLGEMSVLAEGSGAKAKISVQETFALTTPKALPGFERASTAQPSPRPLPPRLFRPMGRVASGRVASPSPRTPSSVQRSYSLAPQNTPRFVVPTSSGLSAAPKTPGGPTTPIGKIAVGSDVLDSGVAKFKTWAENAIKSQQQDITRISGTVEKIEKDMESMRTFMEETKASFKDHQFKGLEKRPNQDAQSEPRQAVAEIKSSQDTGSELPTQTATSTGETFTQQNDMAATEIEDLKRELAHMKEQIATLEGGIKDSVLTPQEHPPAPNTLKRTHEEDDIPDAEETPVQNINKRIKHHILPDEIPNSSAESEEPTIRPSSPEIIRLTTAASNHTPSPVKQGQHRHDLRHTHHAPAHSNTPPERPLTRSGIQVVVEVPLTRPRTPLTRPQSSHVNTASPKRSNTSKSYLTRGKEKKKGKEMENDNETAKEKERGKGKDNRAEKEEVPERIGRRSLRRRSGQNGPNWFQL